MRLWNSATQQWEDVADPAQVQANFLAGTHAFAPDAQVPIEDKYGDAKFVSASDVDKHLADGASITTPERAEQARLQKEYGGLKGQVIAAGEGAARGVSLGGSDVLAVEGARVFGGDETADKVRQHLESEKAANPKTALASEVVGAVAPAVLSGGETAPETAAEVGTELAARAGKPSLLRALARYTPSALVDRAGIAATRAAEDVIGSRSASSALGRIAKAAAAHAIGDAVPGAIYEAAGQFDEDYLSGGNHALTAEKTIAALGHGALWGMLLGGGLAGAGAVSREIASPILRRASPFLDKAAGERVWAAADGTSRQTREALQRVEGGTAAVGDTFLRRSGLGERALIDAALTPEELLPLATRTRQEGGERLDQFFTGHGGQQAGAASDAFTGAFDDVIASQRGKIGTSGAVASLEKVKTEAMQRAGLILNDAESMGVARQHALDLGLTPGTESFKEAELSHMAEMASDKLSGKTIPLQTIREIRQELGDLAYKENKQLDPNNRVAQLRQLYHSLGELEEETLDKHAKSMGLSDTAKADYKQLKKEYQHLRIYEDATKEGARKMQTNRKLSITDYGTGMTAAAVAAAHGNIPGALVGLASAAAHKMVRQRGAALAGVTLHKLSKLDILARSVTTVDRELESATRAFVHGKTPYRSASRFTGPEETASSKAKWKHAREAYPTSQTVTPEHLERALPGLQAQAPQTAKAILQKLNAAALYASENAPRPLNKPTLDDPRPEPRVTAQDSEAHFDRVRAIEDPVGTLTRAMETGRLSAVEYQTLKQNSPEMLNWAKGKLLGELAGPHPDLSSSHLRLLSTLFEGPSDELSDPAVASVMQKTYAQPVQTPQAAPSKGKPITGVADASKTRLEKTRTQHAPGAGA